MLASLGWFAAFTLVPAAQVKAVGQVELLFSWLTARFAFGERPSGARLGIALVAGGIVAVVLAGMRTELAMTASVSRYRNWPRPDGASAPSDKGCRS